MGTIRKIKKAILLSIVVASMTLNFSGCSNNSPLSPLDEEKQETDFTQTSITQDYAQSDIGEITFLKMQSSVLQVFQNDVTDNILMKNPRRSIRAYPAFR